MKAILRFKKMQTLGNVAGMEKHVKRKMEVPNADITKLKENISIVSGDSVLNLHNRLKEIKDNGGIIQKNSVVAIDCLMTASPEFWTDGNKEKERAFIQNSREYLIETFGSENIMSMHMHKDETSPHIHAIVCPAYESKDKWGNKKMRVGAKRWLDGRKKLSEHQDRFAEIMEPLGLERGKKGSKTNHKTIQKFYSELEQKKTLFNSIIKDLPIKTAFISHDKYMKAIENHLLGFADAKKLIEDKKVNNREFLNSILNLVNKRNKEQNIDLKFKLNSKTKRIDNIKPSLELEKQQEENQARESKKETQKQMEEANIQPISNAIFNSLESIEKIKGRELEELKILYDKLSDSEKYHTIIDIAKDKNISLENKRNFFLITKTTKERDEALREIQKENRVYKSNLRDNTRPGKEKNQGLDL